MRELSSRASTAIAIVPAFPLVFFWLLTIGAIIRSFWDPGLQRAWAALPILIIVTGVVLWQIIVPKEVLIDGQYLYIRGNKGEIQVPLTEMKEAHSNYYSKTITITLKSPTEYGQDIVFFPRQWSTLGGSKITDELIDIINSIEDKAAAHKTIGNGRPAFAAKVFKVMSKPQKRRK